jgi:hypothetical protein
VVNDLERGRAPVAPAPPAPLDVPLRVVTDDRHGGRWTSLEGGGREWLWQGTATGRDRVGPGDAFVDAGGLEECVPTVRGTPDHGAAWSRPWRPAGPGTAVVQSPDFTLARQLSERSGAVVARYRLSADPGYRFIWAAHALLDLSPAARLLAPVGTRTRVYQESDAPVTHAWPASPGLPLDRFGPDDGTALGAILVGCCDVRVQDGPDTLRLRLDCEGQPRSTALWRNLRGWPAPTPYRSIGVEPMLGAVFDLAQADPAGGDAAVVPAGGQVDWQLTISAHRSPGGDHR